MTLLVCLEGLDAAGKSTHSVRLENALRADGLAADSWRHEPPSGVVRSDPWAAALHYAQERAAFARRMRIPPCEPVSVVVCDRWLYSTSVASLAPAITTLTRQAMVLLVDAEDRALPCVHTILLDAPLEVVAARMVARGEMVPDHLAYSQAAYRVMAESLRWPVVSTDRDAAAVTRELVAIVRRLLAAAVPQGVCPAPTTEGL